MSGTSQSLTSSLSTSGTASVSATFSPTPTFSTSPTVSASASTTFTLRSPTYPTTTPTGTSSPTTTNSATVSSSPTGVGTRTASSVSATLCRSATPSVTQSATTSFSVSASSSSTVLPSDTSTISPTASSSSSGTLSSTSTLSLSTFTASRERTTVSVSQSVLPSKSATHVESASYTPSASATASTSGSFSQSNSWTETSSPTDDVTMSRSASSSLSLTSTSTGSGTASSSGSTTASAGSPSGSPSASTTTSVSTTSSLTLTPPPTPTPTQSASGTQTETRTPPPTPTPTPSASATDELSSSKSLSASFSQTFSVSQTSSGSASATSSASVSVSVSLSSSATATSSLLASASETVSGSSSATWSLSVSASSTPIQSKSVSLSATLSSSGTATITPPPTPTPTMTGSESGQPTLSRSASPTDEKTPSGSTTVSPTVTMLVTVTPRISSTATLSRTVAITKTSTVVATPSATHTASRSISFSMTEELTFTPTPTASITRPIVKKDARYVAVPKASSSTFYAGRPLHITFYSVPLDKVYDRAGIMPVGTGPCYDAATGLVNEQMADLTFSGHAVGASVTHNWTVTIPESGKYALCYYNSAVDHWHLIDRPSNLTLVPYVVRNTFSFETAIVGEENKFHLPVLGAQIEHDLVVLIPYGRQCADPNVNRNYATLQDYSSDKVLHGVMPLTTALLYTLCYRGYPHTEFVRLSTTPLRFIGQVKLGTVTGTDGVAGARVGHPLYMSVAGAGMCLLDVFYLVNSSTCEAASLRLYAAIQREVGMPLSARTSLKLQFYLRTPGEQTLCYRSNVSRTFVPVSMAAPIVVQAVRATGFSPNSSSTFWSVGSDIVLVFYGEDTSNKYDHAELRCDENYTTALPCNKSMVFPFSPLSYTTDSSHWIAHVALPGRYSVYYGSNMTVAEKTGPTTILVAPRFYNMTTFPSRVFLNTTYTMELIGEGIDATRNVLYATRANRSCTRDPGAGTRPIAQGTDEFGRGRVTFNATMRGLWVVCLVTTFGTVLSSETYGILADPPTSFTPSLVAAGVNTTIAFSGGVDMDLTDNDTVTACTSDAKCVVLVPNGQRTAVAMLQACGVYQLYFTAAFGVAVGTTAAPQLLGELSVSPVVLSTSLSASVVEVGTTVTVAVSGNGLSMLDSLYLCGKENTTASWIVRNATTVWAVTPAQAGFFPLCYSYGVKPSFADGPLGNSSTISVDPVVTSFEPLMARAGKETAFLIRGIELSALQRVFLRPSGTPCSIMILPSDITLTRRNVTVWGGVPTRRGNFTLCYSGAGQVARSAATAITVLPSVNNVTLAQSGSSGKQFYTGYPIDVGLVGASMDYASDVFFVVPHASCSNMEGAVQLTALLPPVTLVNSLTLQVVVPFAADWTLCFIIGGVRYPVTSIADFSTLSSLQYVTETLQLRGPVASIAGYFLFSFCLRYSCATENRGQWVSLQTSAPATVIPAPYLPFELATYRVDAYAANGITQYVMTMNYTLTPSSKFCANFPLSVGTSDRVAEFARSIILLNNFVALGCRATAALSDSFIMRAMALGSFDVTLLDNPRFIFDVIVSSIAISKTSDEALKPAYWTLLSDVVSLAAKRLASTHESVAEHYFVVDSILKAVTQRFPWNDGCASYVTKVSLQVMAHLRETSVAFCGSTSTNVRTIQPAIQTEHLNASVLCETDLATLLELSNEEEGGVSVAMQPTMASLRSPITLLRVQSNPFPAKPLRYATMRRDHNPFHMLSSNTTSQFNALTRLDELAYASVPVVAILSSTSLSGVAAIQYDLPPDAAARGLGPINNRTCQRVDPVAVRLNGGAWYKTSNGSGSVQCVNGRVRMTYEVTEDGLGSDSSQIVLAGWYMPRAVGIVKQLDISVPLICAAIFVAFWGCVGLSLLLAAAPPQPKCDSTPSISLWYFHKVTAPFLYTGPWRRWRVIVVLFSFLFAASGFALAAAEDRSLTVVRNWPGGLVLVVRSITVALCAAPVSTLVRVGILQQPLDIPSVAGGITGLAAVVIGWAVVDVVVGAALVGVGGLVFILLGFVFRVRHSLLPERNYPAVCMGAGILAFVLSLVWMAVRCVIWPLAVGVEENVRREWMFVQVLVGAIVADVLLWDPIQCASMLLLYTIQPPKTGTNPIVCDPFADVFVEIEGDVDSESDGGENAERASASSGSTDTAHGTAPY